MNTQAVEKLSGAHPVAGRVLVSVLAAGAVATALVAATNLWPAPVMAAAATEPAMFPVGPADPLVAERFGRVDHALADWSTRDSAPNPSGQAIALYEPAHR